MSAAIPSPRCGGAGRGPRACSKGSTAIVIRLGAISGSSTHQPTTVAIMMASMTRVAMATPCDLFCSTSKACSTSKRSG